MAGEVADSPESSKHFDPWMIATIVLAAALVASGIWVVVDHQSRQSLGVAPEEVTDVLEGRIAAMNKPDGEAAAKYYALNAVMMELDLDPPGISDGRQQIAERLQGLCGDAGLRLKSVGASIMHDRYVAEPVTFSQEGGPGFGEGMLVFEMNDGGEIQNQWVIGWVDSP